jgi:hypothetical protein
MAAMTAAASGFKVVVIAGNRGRDLQAGKFQSTRFCKRLQALDTTIKTPIGS